MQLDDTLFDDEVDWLDAIERIHDDLNTCLFQLQSAIMGARNHGRTWRQIGGALGISGQGARQRYSKMVVRGVR